VRAADLEFADSFAHSQIKCRRVRHYRLAAKSSLEYLRRAVESCGLRLA
jgi:hypothetical protein